MAWNVAGWDSLPGRGQSGVAAGSARRRLMLRRSTLRADCAALLGPRSRRRTRFAHCVRCARTASTSQMTKRVLRTRRPRACAARRRRNRPRRAPPAASATARGSRPGRKARLQHHASPRAVRREACPLRRHSEGGRGRVAARVCGAEKRMARGRARSALRGLTRRICPSAANEVSVASYAAGRETEHRRAVGATAPTAEASRRRPSATAFAAPTQRQRTGANHCFLRNRNMNQEIAIVMTSSTTASEAP